MYRVEPWDPQVAQTIADLPIELLAPFAELRAALEVSPWTVGRPYVPSNPTAWSRLALFGDRRRGQVLFGVIEREQLVTILQVVVLPTIE